MAATLEVFWRVADRILQDHERKRAGHPANGLDHVIQHDQRRTECTSWLKGGNQVHCGRARVMPDRNNAAMLSKTIGR